jgi:hypothetical protein
VQSCTERDNGCGLSLVFWYFSARNYWRTGRNFDIGGSCLEYKDGTVEFIEM